MVLAGVPTHHGGQESVIRVNNVRHNERAVSGDTCLGWCFDVSVAEASCYDGVHATELAAWLVVEAGAYTTDEGVLLQAGTKPDVEHGSRTSVQFPRPFPHRAKDAVCVDDADFKDEKDFDCGGWCAPL